MSTHLDPNLAQKIVHEVKFQGVFDEFRKDSIADVDTKPAYLNLRQRVENAVQKFLSEQRWTPETNKYQLRDRLRRHITESGFLDVGVERIVDQVVNPKIGSVFQPRIEEIACKYLGLPQPPKDDMPATAHHHAPLPPLPNPINGNALQIDTELKFEENLLPKDLEQVSPDSDKTAILEESTHDIDNGIDEDEGEKMDEEEDESPPFEPIHECKSPFKTEPIVPNDVIKSEDIKKENGDVKAELTPSAPPLPCKDECVSADGLASQESQLSQISSETASNQLNQSVGSDPPTNLESAAATANISEEAQMPKFNENSDETEQGSKKNSDLHFDIKKDEIKFEGTKRKINLLDGGNGEQNNDSQNDTPTPGMEHSHADNKNDEKCAFHFSKLVKVETACNNVKQEAASSVSSQDDTSSAQLCIVEKSEQDLLQTDTNSIYKATQDVSNGATSTTTTQTKLHDENKYKSKSISTTSSSSRHKKSSKSSKRSPEREHHRHRSRDDRNGDSKYNDCRLSSNGGGDTRRQSSSKHRHHSSTSDRHSTSSKREEKRSSSSRSESQSRHSSSKKDYRDRHDSKKHKSHKSSRDDKDSSYKSHKNDDHNESKTKIRRRKSTDSNDDEGKTPNRTTTQRSTNMNSSNNAQSTTANGSPINSSKTNNNNSNTNKESNKHSNDPKQNTVSSNIVVLNEVLTDPAKGFVELETKPQRINIVTPAPTESLTHHVSATEEQRHDDELLYFEEHCSKTESDLKLRLSLIDEAINRLNIAYKAVNNTQQQQQGVCDLVSQDNTTTTNNNNNNNKKDNNVIERETKATLQVDCFQYSTSTSNKNQSPSSMIADDLAVNGIGSGVVVDVNANDEIDIGDGSTQATATKRFKYDAECEFTMKKNSISKRVDMVAKQRYTSEDLYKPRPVLGQRIKRRGLDE